MTVNEVHQALGSWSLRLRPSIPRTDLAKLGFLGHIVIVPGRLDVRTYGDQLLQVARYVGVNRSQDAADSLALGGAGMAYWLGDEQGKGDVYETAVDITAQSFVNSITALLPPSGSVTAGTLNAIAGTYTGRHQWETPRKAIDYVAALFDAEWRVNGNATLDVGTPTQLGYAITPRVLISKFRPSRDLRLSGLAGRLALGKDVEDYTTRVVLLAEGEGASIATGTADGPATPYADVHGNPVVLTRLASESFTTAGNADDRAALLLNQYAAARFNLRLRAEAEDIKGDVVVGDWVYVYDPDNGFFDNANEVVWEGETINPLSLRVRELSWPIRQDWTVAFRTTDGEWVDLSQYYYPEAGDVTLVVGEASRSLSGLGSEPVGSRPTGDLSIPGVPAFIDFSVGAYQSGLTNTTKAAIRATWTTPLNTDGSVILDGDRYEIRYRVDELIGYATYWSDLAAFRWGDDPPFTWGAPLSEPVEDAPEWQTAVIGWGTNAFTLTELTPGVQYELQIRAVDSATPPHFGAWSSSSLQLTSGDLFAPSAPAAPEVSASRIAIQVVHRLGKASGGTFNLEQDLDHLEVHVGGSLDFLCVTASMRGKLTANAAMLGGSIPAVGVFNVEQTDGVFVKVIAVDRSGNKSDASVGVAATALLIDNAHISDLSVSKVTAGSITANWILAAMLEIGTGGNVILTEGAVLVRDALGREVAGLGKNPVDGRYGFWVRDPVNELYAVRAGELAGSGHGLEAIDAGGALVALSALAFGPTIDSVTNRESTTNTAYNVLATAGPTVTVNIGTSGRCIVIVGALIETIAPRGSAINSAGGYMSYDVTGPTPSGATEIRRAGIFLKYDKTGPVEDTAYEIQLGASRVSMLTGLDPGSYTFRALYKCDNGNTAWFSERIMVVLPF